MADEETEILGEEIPPTPEIGPELPSWVPLAPGPSTVKPWLGKLTDYFISAMEAIFKFFADFMLNDVPAFFRERIKEGVKLLDPREEEIWNGIFKDLTSAGIITPGLAKEILRFKSLPAGANTVFNVMMLNSWLGQYVKTLADSTLAPYVQNLNKVYSPNLPNPGNAIAAGFMYPDLQEKVFDILRRHGFSEENIEILFKSSHRMYDLNVVMMLYLRKELDDVEVKDRMFKLGIPGKLADEIMKTWIIIPPVQDILTMVAKEAFEPDQIMRYGLDEEFPAEQAEWLEKQGLTEYWQKKYWIAHWSYPGPGQVLTMLHRGLITEEEVSEYYRVVEMPPFWRRLLSKISFQPYTRVDTRRMHQMGVLSDEELVKAYMDQGYDQEHAEKMAEFTKRYNAQEKTTVTMSQIIKAYRSSMISRADSKDLLKSLRYNDDTAEFLLSQADFTEQLEIQDLYVDSVKTRYTNNLIEDLEARTMLSKLNLPGARIDALLERWNASRIAYAKIPSKTDLDKFLKSGIITTDVYRIEMYRLGYDFRYTDWYLQSTGKAAAAAAKA
uniref:Uncharacterized protein n=1 Tax=viral metagenome TaxID=1070528 RepID=A0A6H1ZMF4_9ZZZZ